MIRPSQLLRLVHINWVLLKHGLDEVILATHLLRPLRFILYITPWYWLRRNRLPAYPVRIRQALEELGPIFVKFGQILSTRRDLLPAEIADELTLLQDRVPPFPGIKAKAIIEKAYKRPVEQVLKNFNATPLASASIAQVHTAQLPDGKEVVVKVLRPGIDRIIRRDVGLLYIIASLAERYWKDGHRLHPVEVVREYEKTILDELDLLREAANAAQLRRNWENSPLLYIPEVYWDFCRHNVIVMERIYGTPVNDVAALTAQGISTQALGERGVEIFFTQVFRDNFFHADMHPGNIFVDPNGRYIAVDFGIVGTLTPEDQHYLAGNMLAFFNRDYRRVAELHVESGWVPKKTRVDEFESAIRTVCEPIFNRPLREISFGHFLVNLFQTARRFEMEIQPQLVSLQKTFIYIEGLGRQLYPDLDLWTTAKPFLERWMHQQIGLRATFTRLRQSWPQLAEQMPEMPLLVHQLVRNAANGEMQVGLREKELAQLQQQLRQNGQHNLAAIAGSALLISAAILLSQANDSPTLLSLATLLGVGGAVILMRTWWSLR